MQNAQVEFSIDEALILKSLKLRLPGLEDEESMLLNQSLNIMPFNHEIPEVEPMM